VDVAKFRACVKDEVKSLAYTTVSVCRYRESSSITCGTITGSERPSSALETSDVYAIHQANVSISIAFYLNGNSEPETHDRQAMRLQYLILRVPFLCDEGSSEDLVSR
jgi:hypothetical protein